MRVASLLLSVAGLAAAQNDPNARCPNAKPYSAQCCYGNKTAAVMGGVDFVDLASKQEGKVTSSFGEAKFASTLNGYTFLFVNAANKAKFEADPWSYAPAWGAQHHSPPLPLLLHFPPSAATTFTALCLRRLHHGFSCYHRLDSCCALTYCSTSRWLLILGGGR